MKFYVSDNIEIEPLKFMGNSKYFLKAKIISLDGVENYEDALKIAAKLHDKLLEV